MSGVRLADGRPHRLLPAHYNGFLLPLAGDLSVGDTSLAVGDIGSLDRREGEASTRLALRAGPAAARVLLDYRAGRFVRLSQLARGHRLHI